MNSQLSTGNITGNLDTLTLKGARINAVSGTLHADTLTIETQQNTETARNKSNNQTIGISSSGGNFAAGQGKGSTDSKVSAEQSGIVFSSADHELTANNTKVVGGIIAHIETDENGNKTNAPLNFTTDTLEVVNLKDTRTVKQSNFGISGGVSASKNNGEYDAKLNTAGVQIGRSGHEYEAETLATIGQGAVVKSDAKTGKNSLAGVNQDALNTTKVIKDYDTGGLAVDASIDTRVFTEEGRASIAKEQKDLGKNIKNTGKITAAGIQSATAATTGLITGDQNLSQAIDTLLNPARAAQFIKDHPDQAAVIKAFQEGNYDGLPKTKEGLQKLANYLKVDVNVLLNNIGVKGITDQSLISLDVGKENRKDTVKVLGHEVAHNQSISSETMANIVGSSVDFAFDAQTAAMDTAIAQYVAKLGDGKDATTQAANTKLLKEDNSQLVKAMMDHPEQMENWGSVGHQSTMQAALFAGGMDPRKARDLGVAAWANDTTSKNAMSATSLVMGLFGMGDQVERHALDGNVEELKALKAAFEVAYKTGDKDKIMAAFNDVETAANRAVQTAKDKAKADFNEVIGKANSLPYGSPEYNEYINSQDVKDKLHLAGDAYAHVDNETFKDDTARNKAISAGKLPEHYDSFLGHVFDSLGWFGGADPDSPVAHKEAYTEMAKDIYKAASNATGSPAVAQGDFENTIKKVTETEVTEKGISTYFTGKEVVNNEKTEENQRNELNNMTQGAIDPSTGKPVQVVTVPDVEWGLLGTTKAWHFIKSLFSSD